MAVSFPNDPKYRVQHHHTTLVGVASQEVISYHSPFSTFTSGQSGVGNFAAGIFVGSPSYPGSKDPLTNQRNDGSAHGQAQLCGSLAWVPMVLALYSMFRCRSM